MSSEEPTFESIAQAGARLRSGATTSVQLVDACLRAIDETHRLTNAFTRVDAEGARQAARSLDAERARGLDRGPLHGIPISVKDLIDQAGTVTTAASHVLDDRIPSTTATVITRLIEAGAVIIGRTNLHEFALGTTSDDSAFGPVHHPGDPTRSPGGSSGGSAAAIATGAGLASIGTDTGGSVRIPAAACGLVGLKPAHGEIPTDGVVPLSSSLDHVGPLAWTVQDAAWLYAVMTGRAPCAIDARPAKGLRLRRLAGYFDRPIDATVRAAFDAALAQLRADGATIDEGTIADADRIHAEYVNIVLPEGAHWHAPFLDTRTALYTPNVHARFVSGRAIPAVDYLRAIDACGAFRRSVDALLADCDALVLPTLPIVAPPIGAESVAIEEGEGGTMPVRAAMLKHTQLFNLTGHPAISVPVVSSGLPVGLQLVGLHTGTAALLEIAAGCEKIVGRK